MTVVGAVCPPDTAPVPDSPYLPIEDYGLIGDMRTAAVVGKNGSVDWMCLPHFDSPSVFGALLDDDVGGRFQVTLDGEYAVRQVYLPDTNVLVTRYTGETGAAEIVDYMPVRSAASAETDTATRLVRHVRALRGTVTLTVRCEPGFDYARAGHTARVVPGRGVVFESEPWEAAARAGADTGRDVAGAGGRAAPVPPRLGLSTKRTLELADGACGPAAMRTLTLARGERATFEVGLLPEGEDLPEPLERDDEYTLFRATTRFWRDWLKTCTYTGRWREQVRRSALLLKMLTFAPTGAIVAAPTTSLPEAIGGGRNWDYRYAWIRDAAFTLYGLLRIGFSAEVRDFIGWLRDRCEAGMHDDASGPLQIVYGIDGRRNLTESTLDHLEGYRQSAPVRIGNGAAGQLQLDIYGELLDAVYLYDKYGTPIAWDFWTDIVRYVDWVCDNWQRPDEGIWEVRGEKEHFVYSKLMCWVALDRALRLADKRSLPAPRQRWMETRDTIYATIQERGWNEERGAFVQAFGSDALDASNLLMPLVFFTGPTDPRMLSTLRETLKAPEDGGLTSDCLVWRYNLHEVDDGVSGAAGGADEEGAFNLCSFWLVEALARAGRVHPELLDKAHILFAKMLGYANHLGLFAEMTGLRGQALGNFPQAFSHLGLISAAFNLDRTLDSVGGGAGLAGTGRVEEEEASPLGGGPGQSPSATPGPTKPRG